MAEDFAYTLDGGYEGRGGGYVDDFGGGGVRAWRGYGGVEERAFGYLVFWARVSWWVWRSRR